MGFKDGFVWGGASAAYQVEGAYNEDGRGLSVWDMFCSCDDAIFDKSNGNTACDHYHRYKEDIALMREIGLKAYRFSISWPRVIPEGIGGINDSGLDFYDRLTDELLKAGIEPYATLFHWDYPYPLYQRGGWLNPDSPKWFAEYTAAVVRRLGDRIKHYFTLNEPQCVAMLGHSKGTHAPGLKLPIWDCLNVAHNLLLAHGLSVKAIRANAKDTIVGYAPVCAGFFPATQSGADIEAAKAAFFATNENAPLWSNTLWNDPVFKGEYPADLFEVAGKHMPKIGCEDMATISQPVDFMAFNTYFGNPVRAADGGKPVLADHPAGYPVTAYNWAITPDVIYWAAKNFYERYGKPIIITENGLSCADVVSLDGKVHDPGRIDYLNRYLLALRKAADEGADIAGYFHWSLTDNFEWGRGYMERFGLVYVDYQTQERILKDSAMWYNSVIESNGAVL